MNDQTSIKVAGIIFSTHCSNHQSTGKMRALLEKLRSLFGSRIVHEPVPFDTPFDFIHVADEIQNEIEKCKRSGNALGIYSPALGPGMFFVSVDDLYVMKDEKIVVLKPYDLHGIELKRDHLSLREISMVTPTGFPFNVKEAFATARVHQSPAGFALQKQFIHI